MGWRGPDYDGEFPSLGWDVLDRALDNFRVPDGPLAGEPFDLTDEQAKILVRFYAINEAGRFVYRRGAVRRAQGWGKSPLLAVICLAELCGPTRFDGWDARGEPVGAPPVAPWVQIAAVSEDQTDNTYAAAYAMASESDLAGTTIDVGLTRMFLKGGDTGRLEPVTAAAGTRLGQRLSFVVMDETHLWTRRNGGTKLAAVLRRNTGKIGGRSFESTNAHEPGENSVAEMTFKAASDGAAGLLYDSVEGPPVPDLADTPAVRESLRVAYGDSARFVDLDRLALEIADPATDPTDARRFYLNQLMAGARCPVDIPQWLRLADAHDVLPGTRIGLGFDGSISNDMTCLYGATVEGYVFKIASWERPDPAPEGWRVPRSDVEAVVAETFATYDVGRMFCDPPRWQTEIERWAETYGDETVLFFDTNQHGKYSAVCDRFFSLVRESGLSHDGGSELTDHLAATARKNVRVMAESDDGRTRFVIIKTDTRKIDAAVAATLAVEAASTMGAGTVVMAPGVLTDVDEERFTNELARIEREEQAAYDAMV
jgi:hypothetical protein